MTVRDQKSLATGSAVAGRPQLGTRTDQATIKVARALQRSVFNTASGLALLWVGWAVLVFYAVLWLMTVDVDSQTHRWQAFIVMALLAQSAIVTGVGLAVMDISSPRAQPKKYHNRAKPSSEAAPTQPPLLPQESRSGAPVSFGVTEGDWRAARLFPDGSVEIETKLGRRRFGSTSDAVQFVGPRAAAKASMH